MQYDYGKAMAGGEFKQMGILNQPPQILLSAVAKVQSAPRKHSKFLAYLESEDWQDEPEFEDWPQSDSDTLFRPEYYHAEGESTCWKCDLSHKVDRKPRKSSPAVHYGTIASGDQVMRDAEQRDKISARMGGVLCFEMEAAGLMNRFNCLVVRGICDYCDSHKDKTWQPRAAAVAAAWAKELLRNISTVDVQTMNTRLGHVAEGTIH